MTAKSLILIGWLALLAWTWPAHAAESYDNCTGFITTLPTTITTQGTWCFNQDLVTAITSGAAITINTNNVTIDCNGFKLGGLAAGAATQTHGIYGPNRLNATVRHCNIRGFYVGLNLQGSSGGGHLIEDNQFDANTGVGIIVQGPGSVVRRNRVFDTGGSTFANDIEGIYGAASVDILDNIVSGVTGSSSGSGNAYGIHTADLTGSTIQGNGVRGLLRSGSGHAYGIYNDSSDRISIRDNDIVGDGDVASIGLYCVSSNGRAIDNNIGNFSSGISFCTDVSGNNVVP